MLSWELQQKYDRYLLNKVKEKGVEHFDQYFEISLNDSLIEDDPEYNEVVINDHNSMKQIIHTCINENDIDKALNQWMKLDTDVRELFYEILIEQLDPDENGLNVIIESN